MIRNKWTRVFIVMLGFALALPAAAQDAASIVSLRAANDAFYAALSRKDAAAIAATWAHEPWVSAVHPSGKDVVVGWESVGKGFGLTSYVEVSVTQKDATTHVDGNIGWVVGTETVRGRLASNGQTAEFQTLVTNIFQKQNGKWLMVHHHANRLP